VNDRNETHEWCLAFIKLWSARSYPPRNDRHRFNQLWRTVAKPQHGGFAQSAAVDHKFAIQKKRPLIERLSGRSY